VCWYVQCVKYLYSPITVSEWVSQKTPLSPPSRAGPSLVGFFMQRSWESSSCMRRPVRWLKQPQMVWCITSTPSELRSCKAAGLASSFRMKHSSSLIFFSPMHTAPENIFAVARGSNPYLLILFIFCQDNCIY
jgi:hypothetical protein